MDDKYYFSLFNAVSAAIELLDEIRLALINAQQESEEQYIEAGE